MIINPNLGRFVGYCQERTTRIYEAVFVELYGIAQDVGYAKNGVALMTVYHSL